MQDLVLIIKWIGGFLDIIVSSATITTICILFYYKAHFTIFEYTTTGVIEVFVLFLAIIMLINGFLK